MTITLAQLEQDIKDEVTALEDVAALIVAAGLHKRPEGE
jgi:hypothetical protein